MIPKNPPNSALPYIPLIRPRQKSEVIRNPLVFIIINIFVYIFLCAAFSGLLDKKSMR